jgi:Pyruvate/2-oxoacid:ferredoxin oxidoreductase gamma subunit
LLASAAFLQDRYAQAFPSFGSERMGAPVMSFCRIDDKPIRTREPVAEPDALLIQDPTLLHQSDLFAGLTADGYVLTHASERVDIPGQDEVDAFLRPYHPPQALDPDDPVSIGSRVGPEAFTEELTEAAGGHAEVEGGFDAAFVAVGAHIGKRASVTATARSPTTGLAAGVIVNGSVTRERNPQQSKIVS